jgi:hypothetical protein
MPASREVLQLYIRVTDKQYNEKRWNYKSYPSYCGSNDPVMNVTNINGELGSQRTGAS